MSSQVFQRNDVRTTGKDKPTLLELLEPRILLSGDGLLNAIMPDEGEDAFIILSESFFPKKMSYFGIVTDHVAFGPSSLYYYDYLYKSANDAKLD